MPPKKAVTKTSEKAPTKAAASKGSAKNTPKKEAAKKESPKKEEAPKTTTPKKPKETTKYERLAQDKNATLPIDVTFAGGNVQAKLSKASFQHSIKLEASAPFSLHKTYTITEGENEGLQVIVLKPAKAFKFMKLPVEVRKRIYQYYFYHKGIAGEPITIDGKRKSESKDPFAKSYSGGSKFRVALLAANKEINKDAMPVLYANPIRFDTPATLLTFFAGLDSHVRVLLRHIEIRQYVKKDAKTALAFLAEAKDLEYLRIEQGVAVEDDAGTAAKSFWLDACKLLESVGARFDKKMVPARKPKFLAEVKTEKDGKEESESEESEEGAEDDEGGKTDDTTSSQQEEASSASGAGSVDASDADAMAVDDNKVADTAATTSEVTNTPKKASPDATTTPKKTTLPEPPQLIQGEKCFAVDILEFGKSAFKNKNSSAWDKKKKQVFLDVLEAKLNLQHLSFWTCICGTTVYGHSCAKEAENQNRSRKEKLADTSRTREQFEHLGHGGAEMINAAYDQVA